MYRGVGKISGETRTVIKKIKKKNPNSFQIVLAKVRQKKKNSYLLEYIIFLKPVLGCGCIDH